MTAPLVSRGKVSLFEACRWRILYCAFQLKHIVKCARFGLDEAGHSLVAVVHGKKERACVQDTPN